MVPDRGSRCGALFANVAAVLWLAAAAPAACPQYSSSRAIGTIASPLVTELSGLAASRQHPGVLWAHNDSGDSARAFAFNTNGAHLGIYNFSGTSAIDWEDMAVGPGPVTGVDYLYLGDIGDNLNIRANIKVYRVAEPTVDASQTPVTATLTGVETITLVYPDGPRDAETLMVDVNGDIYVVSKRVTAVGRVYRAAFPQSTSSMITMQFVAQLPWGSVSGAGGATGGDIAPDGSAIVIRRYSTQSPQATLWLRAPGATVAEAFAQPGCNVALAGEPQGEAICFRPVSWDAPGSSQGRWSYFTASEGASQPIYYFAHQLAPADLNHDGFVSGLDLAILLAQWTGPAAYDPCPPYRPADLNQDCAISGLDLAMLLAGWAP